MKEKDIAAYVDFLKRHEVKDKLEFLYPMVIGCMNNVDHGKRFIAKEKFLEDFDKWKKSEYEDFVFMPEFGLENIIPDDALLDVKFIPLMSSMMDLDKGDEIYLWVIQLHNNYPMCDSKRVNGLCRTSSRIPIKEDIDDMRKSLTVSCLIFGNKRDFPGAFPHLVRHELVHSIISTINNVDTTILDIVDEDGDEFTRIEFDEFIADLLPYYIIYDNPIDKFKDSLYVIFNPVYSSLYETIMKRLSTMSILK